MTHSPSDPPPGDVTPGDEAPETAEEPAAGEAAAEPVGDAPAGEPAAEEPAAEEPAAEEPAAGEAAAEAVEGAPAEDATTGEASTEGAAADGTATGEATLEESPEEPDEPQPGEPEEPDEAQPGEREEPDEAQPGEREEPDEPQPEEPDEAQPEEPDELADFAARLAERIGATWWATDHATVRLRVDRERWVDSVAAVGEELPFFSWLSAVDWSREVAVGEVAENVDDVEERYEVLCRLSSVRNADAAVVFTSVPKDDPAIDTLVGRFGGAEWHEREAAEMFGIEFRGHPNLTHLYLPDAFEGHPLRKSYALLSREVKPWPGTVDVEGLPSADGPTTENVEAGDAGTGSDEDGAG